jgi:hypothetical protein
MLVAALQGCDWDADKAYKVRRRPTCRQPLHWRRRAWQNPDITTGVSPHNAVCAAQQVMAKFSMQSRGAGKKQKEPSEKKSKKEKAKHKKERKRKHSSKRNDSDSDSGSDSSECAKITPYIKPCPSYGVFACTAGVPRATPCMCCEPPVRQPRAPGCRASEGNRFD